MSSDWMPEGVSMTVRLLLRHRGFLHRSFSPQASTAARAAVASLHVRKQSSQLADMDVKVRVGVRVGVLTEMVLAGPAAQSPPLEVCLSSTGMVLQACTHAD